MTRPQIGLMLSCGEPKPEGGVGRKLDYIRPKPGALGQFAEAAARFTAEYGDRPRSVDLLLVSDLIPEVLDVRPMVWGASGLKAIGRENLAMYGPGDEFAERIRSYDWDLMTFPEDSPEPGSYTLTRGREDPAVTKLKLKVYSTLYVAIPKVTGLMMLAAITTSSARSATNWHNALHLAHRITAGVLVGIPFRLILRPARSRYFDKKEGKRKPTEFQEWCLESVQQLPELYEIATTRREMLNGAAPRLALPAAGSSLADPVLATSAAADVPFVAVEAFEELVAEVEGEEWDFAAQNPPGAREPDQPGGGRGPEPGGPPDGAYLAPASGPSDASAAVPAQPQESFFGHAASQAQRRRRPNPETGE